MPHSKVYAKFWPSQIHPRSKGDGETKAPCNGRNRTSRLAFGQLVVPNAHGTKNKRTRDGIVQLSRKIANSRAHIVTVAVTATSEPTIFANVEDVESEAPLKVELLDEFDRDIPEFSGNNAATVSQSGTRTRVTWKKPLPVGKPFAIRVTLPSGGDAKLYALYVGGQ